jgi:hypothetical protein
MVTEIKPQILQALVYTHFSKEIASCIDQSIISDYFGENFNKGYI